MKIVLQRVCQASVSTQQKIFSKINKGFLLLIGVEQNDNYLDADWLIKKILALRVFYDEHHKMNLSIVDILGEILCVSQFTLLADYKKGNRPSFIKAAHPEKAKELFDYFIRNLSTSGLNIQQGIFGADMQVSLINDGPVTIVLNSKTKE